MATVLTKDVILPGVFHTPKGRVAFSADDVRQMHANANRLLKNGFTVPACWRHGPDNLPVTSEDLSRGHAAYSQQFALGADGRLGVAMAFDDPADAAQAKKVKYVSPGLKRDYVDGKGNQYPGWSVVHVAITPRPVNPDQKPFAELSLGSGEMLYLSLAELAMADDKDAESKTDETEAKTELEGKPKAEADETPDGEEAGVPTEKLAAGFEALRKLGLMIPDGTTAETVWDMIPALVDTKLNAEGEMPLDEEPDPEDSAAAPPDKAAVPQGVGATVAMSLDAATAKLVTVSRKELVARAKRLVATKRVPLPLGQKLEREALTVELSLTAEGDVAPNVTLAKIAAYEELPAGAAFGGKKSKSDLDAATAVELSSEQRGGELTPAEAAKLVDQLLAKK